MFGFKRKKSPPVIKTQDFELEFCQNNEEWILEYKDVKFYFPGSKIIIPKVKNIDIFLSWIVTNQDHIDVQVQYMTSGWGDDVFVDASKSHVCSITVHSDIKISAMIVGDETWGDMFYSISFENGKIVDEGFAD